MKKMITLLAVAGLLLGAGLGTALAAEVELGLSSFDRIVGQRMATAVAALGYYEGGGNGVVGEQGSSSSGDRTITCQVLGFTLPSGTVTSAVLTVVRRAEIKANAGYDADLYGFVAGVDPTGTGTNYYYEGADDPDTGVTKLADAFMVNEIDPLPTTNNVDVTTFVQSLYSGETPTQTEVFFRLSCALEIALGTWNERTRMENNTPAPLLTIGGTFNVATPGTLIFVQ